MRVFDRSNTDAQKHAGDQVEDHYPSITLKLIENEDRGFAALAAVGGNGKSLSFHFARVYGV